MIADDSSHDNGAQPTKVVATSLRSPYAEAHTDDIAILVASDVEREHIHPAGSMDVEPSHVGDPVGVTSSEQTTVAEEGDGILTAADVLKDRSDSVIGPQWGDGRTTWHPNDVTSSPSDHGSLAALSALKTDVRKKEVQRLFGKDSYLKLINDGTGSDDEGNRHKSDVDQRIAAFCEQLEFHAYQKQVGRVYDQLPPEPFQPIGGHESAGCQASCPVNLIITDVHLSANGDLHPLVNNEYSWDLDYTAVKHVPTTCPYCHQCRCGNYHFDEPPKNGVETRILAAMLLIDEERIQDAEDSKAAFSERLQERDGYNKLVTYHALNPIQILQTARKHYDRNKE